MVIDPESGATAYMISGGLCGGITSALLSITIFVSVFVSVFFGLLAMVELELMILYALSALVLGTTIIGGIVAVALIVLSIYVIGVIFNHIYDTIDGYREYLETGNLDIAYELSQEAMWEGIFTIGCMAAGALLKKAAGIVKGAGSKLSIYIEQLDNFSQDKINHIINGSKNSNHGWEKLVADKNWNDIKVIIAEVMDNGVEGPYKSVFSKKAMINGYEVEVTYTKLGDGTIKISDAWINQ